MGKEGSPILKVSLSRDEFFSELLNGDEIRQEPKFEEFLLNYVNSKQIWTCLSLTQTRSSSCHHYQIPCTKYVFDTIGCHMRKDHGENTQQEISTIYSIENHVKGSNRFTDYRKKHHVNQVHLCCNLYNLHMKDYHLSYNIAICMQKIARNLLLLPR